MKKLSKILCAVLVIAMLCSSLIFMVGAEEETPAYTSVPADTQMTLDTVKYNAEDNLIQTFTRPSNSVNGWNGEGARQAHIVTNTKTGESWYREWFDGDKFILSVDEVENKGGNEYIQFNFAKQSLVYEEGFNEYIIVDMDLAHSAKNATIWDKTKYTASSVMKQEVIGRTESSTSWATVQNYKDFGLGDGFKHVTVVYDYTSGNAYVFTNGEMALSYTNGALTSAVLAAYKSGTTVNVSEWRIGSNSADEFHMANAYVRYAKNASAEDDIAAAIASGKLSNWSGNVYDADYVVPTPYWFVKSGAHTELADWTNKINDTTNSVLDTSVAGNLYNGSSTSIGNGIDLLGVKSSVSENDTYVTFYGAQSGSTNKKNVFWQFNTVNAPNVSVAPGSTAYYVVDLDVATHGQLLPYVDVSVMLRRISDGGGFPFSCLIDLAPYVNSDSEWNHITIVGDIGANQCYVYVNGKYAGNPGYAYKASELSGNTELSPKGIRVELGLSNMSFDVVKGQDTAFDNFAQRVYTDVASTNGLADAVAAGDITGWTGYVSGNAGTYLPVIATVNGTPYSNSANLTTALASNEKLDVEFFSVPATAPVVLQANATVKTNGFNIADLFTLAPSCEIVSNENGVVKTYAPFVSNVYAEQAFTTGGSAVTSVYNAIKYNVSGNIFNRFNPVSLQVGGVYQPTWGTPGFRNGELVTNKDNGDVYYRESVTLLPDGTMADGVVLDASNNVISFKEADKGSNTFVRSNEYVNFYFDSTKLTYEAGKNEYIVIDFDFGTDDVISDPISVQVIPRSSGGAWASDIYLSNLPITPGEMAHVTLVFDYSTNYAHVFVDGVFAYSVAEAAMDGDKSGGRDDGNKWKDQYLKGTQFSISEFKLCSDRRISTVCFDNVAIRAYDLAVADDAIGAAVKAGDITTWADSIYNENYVTTKFPAVATVDGVGYSSVTSLNAALAVETDGVKNVTFHHHVSDTIEIRTEANVQTYGLDLNFDYKTGAYEFVPQTSDGFYLGNRGKAVASSRLTLVYEEGSTVYKFVGINDDNCTQYWAPVFWFDSANSLEEYQVVFYAYGDQITPPAMGGNNEIINGVLVYDKWSKANINDNGELVVGEEVTSFNVATLADAETYYVFAKGENESADFIVPVEDLKQNAEVNTDITLNIYVPADKTISTGDATYNDGENEYIVIETEILPHEAGKTVTVEFEVQDENGNVYVQKQEVSFVSYAETILKADDQTAETKQLVASILAYSSQAAKVLTGNTIASADQVVAEYNNALPEAEPKTVYETAALGTVIHSAAMKLKTVPEFIFRIVRGFNGTIEFSYTNAYGETVNVPAQAVDATACEQLVALSLDACDINSDITITAKVGDEVVATGNYNLSSYANGLQTNGKEYGFANALMVYSELAKAYKNNAEHPTYNADGTLNIETLDKSEVVSETLKLVNDGKIKQFDQSKEGDHVSDHFSEGGTAVYVQAYKENKPVEALYFSRSVAWIGTGENSGWSEFRFNTDKSKKMVSISFDYFVIGSTESAPEIDNQKKPVFGSNEQVQLGNTYVEAKASDGKYYCIQNDAMIVDSAFDEWHKCTITIEGGQNISNILVKLYHFQGEMLISNVVFNYAE